MVSGSSIANVVTTGTFTIPLMKRIGYTGTKAAAIEVASSVNGQLAPPVMGAAAFIIAEYVNVPYVEVAKADSGVYRLHGFNLDYAYRGLQART